MFGPPVGRFGVGQAANFTACSNDAVCFHPSAVLPVASIFSIEHDLPPLGVFGLGHEEQPLPDVWRPEARSAQIRRPDGVTRSSQITRNNVEPSESVVRRNLLAKNCVRAALSNEPEPCRP